MNADGHIRAWTVSLILYNSSKRPSEQEQTSFFIEAQDQAFQRANPEPKTSSTTHYNESKRTISITSLRHSPLTSQPSPHHTRIHAHNVEDIYNKLLDNAANASSFHIVVSSITVRHTKLPADAPFMSPMPFHPSPSPTPI